MANGKKEIETRQIPVELEEGAIKHIEDLANQDLRSRSAFLARIIYDAIGWQYGKGVRKNGGRK